MKITWTNLHYFVFAAISLNFVLLYALSANQFSNESLVDKQRTVNAMTPILLLKVNETQTHSINSPLHSQTIDPISNNSSSSVAEDIGRSISSGSKPYPIPVTGAIKTLVEVTQEEADAFIPHEKKERPKKMIYLLVVIIVIFAITMTIYGVSNKKKEWNNMIIIDNNPNDKYILLEAEAD